MTYSIKKKLTQSIKSFGYRIWSIVHGRIKGIQNPEHSQSIELINSTIEGKYNYKIYNIKNGRLYTDTVTDTAYIIKDKIIEGPSFQLRSSKNSKISDNIVFKKGTPKIKKKLKGKVFSLLTGGGGNTNYFHWLFDVLPRINILENCINLNEIDFFLFPNLEEKFQIETLDLLNIPKSKRISSLKYRHIKCDNLLAVDHPYVIKNDPTIEIQNIPYWILKYLRKIFLENFKKNNSKKTPKKIYIDRKDAKSNHANLRKIINEEEVKNLLTKNGYSIVALSELTFLEQINLFNNASHIIGLHGAGFSNCIFCEPETFILELQSNTAGPVIKNLAEKTGLNYQSISVKPINSNNDQQGLIKVPVELIKKKTV